MEYDLLERELIQARLLSAIFARTTQDQLVLKGGMALRALFGSMRYTKDIDLGQDQSQPLRSLQRTMREAIASATKGVLVDLEVTEPKQTETTARWKVNGSTKLGTQISVTIEVSRRGVPTNDYLETRYYAPPEGALSTSVEINVYGAEAMAASKVFCLANPNRSAPRDLYDLDLLIRMDVMPAKELLQVADAAATIKSVWDKLEIITWEQFNKEVVPFIENEVRDQIDEEQFNEMRIRVGTTVEHWLEM